MIDKLKESDRQRYIELATAFYSTDAVYKKIDCSNMNDTFDELIKGNNFCDCVVARIDQKIVGYALLAKTWSQEGGGIVVWIEEFFVVPSCRNKGIGKEILDYVLKNYKCARMRLEVEPENEGAVKLYEKYGFEFIPYSQMWIDFRNKK